MLGCEPKLWGPREPAGYPQDTVTSTSNISVDNHPLPTLTLQDSVASKNKSSLHKQHPCCTEMYLHLLTLLLWTFQYQLQNASVLLTALLTQSLHEDEAPCLLCIT